MADSNVTKRALAEGLKQLMERRPFAKISVGDICESCNMNRKSFYYHFRDKYDLVNWIFYTEFVHTLNYVPGDDGWQHLLSVCRYFHDILESILLEYFKQYFKADKESTFAAEFYSDALICSLVRWLVSKNSASPEEYTEGLRSCIKLMRQQF